ncbi:MAG TPA: hypothetical protein VK308_09490 [Pyrinomonadaceae bacterium]|nr:hypothetical protein [Pyrinomonadaceae bacterium]
MEEMRVYADIGTNDGTITFSLPETNGQTVHSYVHQSACAENDRTNTNEAMGEDVVSIGGSFSFSFPVDSAQKTIRGNASVTEEDGSKTDYTWTLRRK